MCFSQNIEKKATKSIKYIQFSWPLLWKTRKYCVLHETFKTSGRVYLDKTIVIYKKIQTFLKAKTHCKHFYFFVKFTVFVSVEQGDINKLCFCVSEKVYLGYTAATKSCYPKKEKLKSRAKKVKHNSLFFQKSLLSRFISVLVHPVIKAEWKLRECYFDVLFYFIFSL